MFFTFCLLTLFLGVSNADSRPNVLFLMMDQLRFDALGSVGNPGAHTPNLDWLASQGVRFSNAYTTTPTCTPARSAILTGLSPWYHGMLGYGVIAPRYAFELPRAMSDGGYFTQSIGKDHFGWNNSLAGGISHGFNATLLYDGIGTGLPNGTEYDNYDQWFQDQLPGANPLETGGLDWNSWQAAPYVFPEFLHPTAWVGRNAVEFINNYDRPEPLFLKVSFHRPHGPYDPPERLLNLTLPEDLPKVVTGGNWDSWYHGGEGYPPGCGPEWKDAWCGAMPEDELTLSRRAYYANIRFVDEWIGEIFSALGNRSMLDNTFILFASDHGDGQGTHFHWRKGYPYEFSAHVPLIVRWPDGYNVSVPRGSVSPLVAEMRDILPTFLDVAGISVPPDVRMDGLPLTCALRDPGGASCGPTGWRQYIDLEHNLVYNETCHWNGFTDGKMKYVFRAFFPDEQLFNLTADPAESNNLAEQSDYYDELVMWRQRLITQFETEQRGPSWVLDGQLQRRVQGQLYSPYYPGDPSLIPDDAKHMYY
eukprot:TRINITY_DN2948_c3_g1_i1.p1 TRINITY_DN2948_c3_g1~~TRINITY_DN2948_c3_g1_i1.p1  ORF type:complete len:533 (-),score=138.11 TRINITY_DN2948_c3_g1_i1:66-1664(-)